MKISSTLILDVGDSLSKALDEILRNGTAVVITKQGKYYGIVDDRNISRGITHPSKVKCSHVSVRAPCLYPKSSLYDGLQAFMAGHFKALPVVNEKNKPLGITTRTDLLEDLLSARLLPKVEVSSLMNSPIYTILAGQTLADAKSLMKQKRTHRLVVVEKGRPKGILSTFDIAGIILKPKGKRGKSVISEVRSLDEKKIDELLRGELSVIKSNRTILEAAQKMVNDNLSTLLVTMKGKYVGVIAATDIFKYLLQLTKEELHLLISGLGEEERFFLSQIRDKLTGVLKKYSKSFNIENASVHFKKGKSTYTARLFLLVNRRRLSITAEEYDLKTTVNELAREVSTVLHKRKDVSKHRKRRKEEWE